MDIAALKAAATEAAKERPNDLSVAILAFAKRYEALERYARDASEALLKTRPLGGSELFKRLSEDEYLADPAYCGGLIDQLRSDLHEARARTARAVQS